MRFRLIATFFVLVSLALGYNNAMGHLQGRISNLEDGLTERTRQSERDLREAYDTLAPMLDETGRKKLSLAQAAWHEYKNAECEFTSAHSAVQPLHPLSFRECVLVMNTERMETLQAELEWRRMLEPGVGFRESVID